MVHRLHQVLILSVSDPDTIFDSKGVFPSGIELRRDDVFVMIVTIIQLDDFLQTAARVLL
ncbi:hypothetical protein JXA80_13815 [bacterium]|nr:hypothetical protein [candidate division CSSED10-310 bacterium]